MLLLCILMHNLIQERSILICMKAITLRNLPGPIDHAIRKKAKKQGLSINKALVQILEEHLGEKKTQAGQYRFHDLDALAGSWSEKDAIAFDHTLAQQRAIDLTLWQ